MTEATRWCLEPLLLLELVSLGTLVLRLILIIILRHTVLGLDSAPQLLIHFVLVEVTPWVSSATSEEVNRVSMGKQHMAISRRGDKHS